VWGEMQEDVGRGDGGGTNNSVIGHIDAASRCALECRVSCMPRWKWAWIAPSLTELRRRCRRRRQAMAYIKRILGLYPSGILPAPPGKGCSAG
jgi:hypothetical protein